MYIATKYIQLMSRRTLWPWKGNIVLLKKIPSQVLSSLPLKTLLLSQQQNQLSSAILTASYVHPQKLHITMDRHSAT